MNGAIGVIDSGVGGLTVAKEIMRQLPRENIIYVGDTLRCPYGSRPKEEVLTFTWQMVEFLFKKDVKAIVVACNTATAFALSSLKAQLHIPIVGVIQAGARAAITTSKTGNIGVIGTEGTIRSGAYADALNAIDPLIRIEKQACPLFVPMVEQGILRGDKALEIIEASLKQMNRLNEIDTLILGCTHYPLLQETIQKVVGPKIQLISSSDETARETSTILDVQQLLYKGKMSAHHKFFTTGNLYLFEKVFKQIFTKSIDETRKTSIHKIEIA